MDLCWQSNVSAFYMLSSFYSKEQASFNFMAAVIICTICSDFGDPKNKVCHYFHCFPIYLPWSDGDAMILVFWMLSFMPTFSLSFFTVIKGLFSSSPLSAWRGGVICLSEVIDISSSNLDSSLCFIQPGILQDILCI